MIVLYEYDGYSAAVHNLLINIHGGCTIYYEQFYKGPLIQIRLMSRSESIRVLHLQVSGGGLSLLHHHRLYLTSPHLCCFWLLESCVSVLLLYSRVVHLVLVLHLLSRFRFCSQISQ